MTAVAELPDVESAFASALAADAGQQPESGPPLVPPPRKSDNPDAPHGYEDDGTTPKAPYGHKPDGRPRIKPGGPGRAAARTPDDKPRTTDRHAPQQAAGASATDSEPDYTEDLIDLGMSVWLAGSMLRGGRLWFLKLPDTRPYAAVWAKQLPGMATAWNAAAKQNSTVRGYVEKFSGEGSRAWMIGVAVTSVSLVAGCMEMARATPEIRANAAEINDADLDAFLTAQMNELGLTELGAAPDQQAAA